ncbi:hypothetical protein MuYL_2981 [Mucilaginibacter xinganensis]|uniref:Uncharacterized protein n=1 Tax=Mucilaginibacter xinganensis TaxID=1234841 RepID=A0A223NYG0_9SPHI|nr:hypothetical protein MuYL_2981 [Mucilaginibacter xinganensis]
MHTGRLFNSPVFIQVSWFTGYYCYIANCKTIHPAQFAGITCFSIKIDKNYL